MSLDADTDLHRFPWRGLAAATETVASNQSGKALDRGFK